MTQGRRLGPASGCRPSHRHGGLRAGHFAAARDLDTSSWVVPQRPNSSKPRGATDDSNRTASQTVNVVPDGTRQMDDHVAGQQSLQPGAVESCEKCTVQDFFPAPPLVGAREILQMLRVGMHDVEVG
jgi:hypothetical protein